MKKTATALMILWLAGAGAVSAEDGVTEDFEDGYTTGEPLRVHDDWFFEPQNNDPTCEEDVGCGESVGVSKGDRAFTWVAYPFRWSDPTLVAVTVGGDWSALRL